MVTKWIRPNVWLFMSAIAMHATCLAQQPESSANLYRRLEAEVAELKKHNPAKPEGAEALATIIQDQQRDSLVRVRAIERCIEIETDSQPIRDALVKTAAADPDPTLRGTAIMGFDPAGVPPEVGVPVLIASLDDDALYGTGKSVTSLRDNVAYALARYGPAAHAAIPKLSELTDVDPKHYRPFVNASESPLATALGQIAPEQYPFFAWGKPAVLPLASVLVDSSDIELRRGAAMCLHAQPLEVVYPAADALHHALDDVDEQTRFYSALTLVRLGNRGRAVEILLPAQHNADAAWRERFASGLGEFDPRLEGTDQILRQMLDDEVPGVRISAVRSFNNVEIWHELLSHRDITIRIIAAKQLIQNKVHYQEAFDTLHEVLKGSDVEATYPAIRAMHGLPDDVRAPSNVTLVRLLDGPQKWTVMIARNYLVRLKEPTPELRDALAQAAKEGNAKAQRVLDAWDRREKE